MGASSLLFLDSLTHLAVAGHVGGVEVLNLLHRFATPYQFGPCHEEGPAGLRGQLVRSGPYITFANGDPLVPGKRVCQSLLLRSLRDRPGRFVSGRGG
jgi:hypothetical protein